MVFSQPKTLFDSLPLDLADAIAFLLQLGWRERWESFFLGWGMQDIARGKVFGLAA